MNPEIAQQLEKEADNMPIEIGFMKLSECAILPSKAHEGDSGFDLYAAEDVIIEAGETKKVKTNIAVVLPPGYEAQVRPRSGITSKTKLRVQIGTIDNAYRGDVGIIVDNIALNYMSGTYIIRKGYKLAQLVVQALPQVRAVEVHSVDDTERGDKGFGSSGV